MRRNFLFLLTLLILAACLPIASKTPTTATPTQTKEPIKNPKVTATALPKILIETDFNVENDKLPIVSYEDFASGKVLEAERKYLETHSPFNGKEIWPNRFDIRTIHIFASKSVMIAANKPPMYETYYKDPSLLPCRNIFRFRVVFPSDFFPKQDESKMLYNFTGKDQLVIYGQVWLNPDSKSENPADKYRVLHYLYGQNDKIWLPTPLENNKMLVPFPIYSIDSTKNKDTDPFTQLRRSLILKFYDKDLPLKYFQEWVKTNKIPSELETFILPSDQHGFSKLY